MTAPSNSPEIALPPRLRHFTDREAAISAFEALWPGDGSWVLSLTGMSGNGKTTLIDYLIEARCKPAGIPWAILDFEGDRGLTLRTDWRALLDTLASQWKLAAHSLYASSSQAARAEYESVRRSLQVKIEQKTVGGQIESSPISIDASQSEALRQAQQRARHATASALSATAVDYYGDRPLALFLDTYELLAEGADKEYVGWLWAWLTATAAQLPGLRVIAGGRQELSGLSRREHQHEALGAFTCDESNSLLCKLGVDDPAWRAAVFTRLASGHPLLTEMAADLWQEAQESGSPLPVEAIPKLAGQEKAVEWLTGRILDRLEGTLKNAVRWASLLRRFNQEILAALLPEDAGTLSENDFDRLSRYSFISPARVGGGLACHDLLRRVQNSYLLANKPRAYQAFHARAASFFADEEGAEVEALYHMLLARLETAPETWRESVHAAYLHLDWPRWAALLEVVESPEVHLSPQLDADAQFWRGQWHRWRYEMASALHSYAQALDLFRAVGDRLGEANTILAISDLAYSQGDFSKANEGYHTALALYQAIGDRYSQARAYYRMGDLQREQGEVTEARQLYSLSRDIWVEIGLEALVEQIIVPRMNNL